MPERLGSNGATNPPLLALRYLLCLIGALISAAMVATFCDWMVHRAHDNALLLLPISNIRFWFIPFTGGACAAAAAMAGRPSAHLVAATCLFVVGCVTSVLQWLSAGRRLGPHWTGADVAAVMAERNSYQLFGGSVLLAGMLLFVIGVVRSLRKPWRPRAAAEQGNAADNLQGTHKEGTFR